MKRILSISLCCIGALTMMGGCGNNAAKKAAEDEAKQAEEAAIEAARKEQAAIEQLAKLPDEPVFDLNTNLGTIKVKLYSKTPKHRENFAKLALTGYFDGMLFHRVINGFMIQGGDPLSKDPENKSKFGTGGPGYTVEAEILPELTHKKGALAAARRGDAANPKRESSGSQFYLVQNEQSCAQLDGAYTVFGETVEGLDVIDKIAAVPTDQRDCPLSDVKIISVKLDPKLNSGTPLE